MLEALILGGGISGLTVAHASGLAARPGGTLPGTPTGTRTAPRAPNLAGDLRIRRKRRPQAPGVWV